MDKDIVVRTENEELKALFERMVAALKRNGKSEAEALFVQYFKLYFNVDKVSYNDACEIEYLFQYDSETILQGFYLSPSTSIFSSFI